MRGATKSSTERKEMSSGRVAVAIDRDKNSQHALKWAVDHIVSYGNAIGLVHVSLKPFNSPRASTTRMYQTLEADENTMFSEDLLPHTKELLLPFRCYCARKNISTKCIVLEDTDVARGIVEYVSRTAIDVLVVGASHKGGIFKRFRSTDVAAAVMKNAPDFCTVYAISKGKVVAMRSAPRPAPVGTPLLPQLSPTPSNSKPPHPRASYLRVERAKPETPPGYVDDSTEMLRSPFARSSLDSKPYGDLTIADTDISFVSSGTPNRYRLLTTFESYDPFRIPKLSSTPKLEVYKSFESANIQNKSYESPPPEISLESSGGIPGSRPTDDAESEMRRLKIELKQTMDVYSTACKDAHTANERATELQRRKMEEEQRLKETRLAEEAAMAIIEKEKAKSKAAIEAAEAAQRIAELEAQKRINAEKRMQKEKEEKKKALESITCSDYRYRRYTIEEIEAATECFTEKNKIGEGGYGPVYKGSLDHTLVAIKVLRPDASQGRSQFQQEIEVLSWMRHPNLVLLLGACPEYGCLVYEYMARGSLEDRLMRKGGTPPLSWQTRFRIAAEIGTGLLFLHQSKPEPLVHRDLKPGNILLDRHYVSKIADVGLARLVPTSVAENVTQYRMTVTAGTFCYIDPEYQQTGMLGVKSDIYSLGVVFLQLISAKPPMGLTHYFNRAIEKGAFQELLDPVVPEWPIEETLLFAKMALRCAELRRKDRPDLAREVLPLLNRLRLLAEESSPAYNEDPSASPSSPPTVSQISMPIVDIDLFTP